MGSSSTAYGLRPSAWSAADAADYWKYYEQGRLYNMSLTPSQYNLVNTNVEFFSGNQWINMSETEAMSRLPRPTFNIIKRIVSLFVASLTSSNTTISFSPLSYIGEAGVPTPKDGIEAATFAQAEVRNLLEKFKMDYRIRDALYDGAITGDYCAHFYFDPTASPYGGALGSEKGEIKMELVDGINVMFGNPNVRDVEKQPYIIIVGRDTVANLKREYMRHNPWTYDAPIYSDGDNFLIAGNGGKSELSTGDDLNSKALYIYFYYRDEDTGTIRVTKCTRDTLIFSDVDTGLNRYPIAWGNWEHQKNQYHGRALVTGIVPNQIYINSMMAMVFRSMMTQSFNKIIYNADVLPYYNNEVGVAIGIRNLQPGQKLDEVISAVRPPDLSSQILYSIDKCMEYTKECLGATDAQLGNVRPDNTSALMVLQSSAEVPLENIRAGLHEWIEDIGAILIDMMGTYYGRRKIVVDTEGTIGEFDFSVFKHLWLSISADVGATTYYSEIATVQTLDNLRRDGTLEVIDYLERIPDKLIPRKSELIRSIKERTGLQPINTGQTKAVKKSAGIGNAMAGETDSAKKFASLTGGVQAAYNSLPSTARKALTG